MAPRISYVLPVHNQEAVIAHSVASLRERLQIHPGSEILLIENGSSDTSAAVCAALAQRHGADAVPVRMARSAQGMGHALRCGIEHAHGDVLVLTAADMPFGFTDLDAYLTCRPRPAVAIGSKAHAASRTRIPLQRRVMSQAFRLLRWIVLGLHVRDSQGTILIDAQLARALAPKLCCGDYLISTEIVTWASRMGHAPVELPVTYVAPRSSTVSPIRDSVRMAKGLFALRWRLRSQPAAR
ncbi:MAG TPA: glycosyltransferase family 2 protein [Candidatus Dormibacteraeota bacterium]